MTAFFCHTGSTHNFKKQSSLPSKFYSKVSLDPQESNYARSKSDPVDTKKKVRCARNRSNKAWKIFDRYHDQLATILCSNATLYDHMLELLSRYFLIMPVERYAIQQLSCLEIRSKTLMRRISVFISNARNPIRVLAKFAAIIQEVENFNSIYAEMKIEGNAF